MRKYRLSVTWTHSPTASGRDSQIAGEAGVGARHVDAVHDDAVTRGLCQFLECGPGKVLSGLVKRINRDASCIALEDPVALTNAVKECSV